MMMADSNSVADNMTEIDSSGNSRTGGVEVLCNVDNATCASSEGDSVDQLDDMTKKLNKMSTCLRTASAIDGSDGCDIEDDFVLIGGNPEHNYFDGVVGAIEDIVMGEDFHVVQTGYLDKYWPEFSEDQTENLHPHFEMFKEYSQGVSAFIEAKLRSILANFDMEDFVEQLGARIDLDGDIFDMLFTLIDFVKFRELVLDYRAMKEGKNINLSSGILVKSIHHDKFQLM